jgi:hypothetical protein
MGAAQDNAMLSDFSSSKTMLHDHGTLHHVKHSTLSGIKGNN